MKITRLSLKMLIENFLLEQEDDEFDNPMTDEEIEAILQQADSPSAGIPPKVLSQIKSRAKQQAGDEEKRRRKFEKERQAEKDRVAQQTLSRKLQKNFGLRLLEYNYTQAELISILTELENVLGIMDFSTPTVSLGKVSGYEIKVKSKIRKSNKNKFKISISAGPLDIAIDKNDIVNIIFNPKAFQRKLLSAVEDSSLGRLAGLASIVSTSAANKIQKVKNLIMSDETTEKIKSNSQDLHDNLIDGLVEVEQFLDDNMVAAAGSSIAGTLVSGLPKRLQSVLETKINEYLAEFYKSLADSITRTLPSQA